MNMSISINFSFNSFFRVGFTAVLLLAVGAAGVSAETTEEMKKSRAKILKEKGYNIARRTVAKYREQLNIPVARLRKEL